ncbi:IS110 family transposase [Paenibacillus cellulositrophicus]|uniref:IS110 family transposase n=1 Tax=Paenibacillus cellulositrophicus TaxID=562959 RepID=UPI0012675211
MEEVGPSFLGQGPSLRQKLYYPSYSRRIGGLHSFLKLIEEESNQQPMVILESTGHYHLPVTRFLEEHHFLFVVVNPILSYQAKESSTLRKVKTVTVDAYAPL